MSQIDVIAFDADDTLWHNERFFVETEAKFAELLRHYHSAEWISERLYETESRNMKHFGYGIKAFALSMIETAVELTEGRVSGRDILQVIDWAKEMLNADVQLLANVPETLAELAKSHHLMVITKGDLLDQERKIVHSGLRPYFQHIEVVSDKTTERYQELLKKHTIEPERFLMVGNSLRSDILPVLELQGRTVHIPYETTWQHEIAELPSEGHPGYYKLSHFAELPDLVKNLSS